MTKAQSHDTIFLDLVGAMSAYTQLWLIGEMFNPHKDELRRLICVAQKNGLQQTAFLDAMSSGYQIGYNNAVGNPHPNEYIQPN